MSQHSLNIANQAFAATRSDLNNALVALGTLQSGATAPATTFAHMLWADTTSNLLKKRNAANSGWLVVRTLDESFVLSRAANTILVGSDVGKTIVATAGFTQTFTAAATLGDGWYTSYNVQSGATIVFDPNGAENIDGAATKSVVGPSSGFIFCNGTAFYTIGFPGAAAAAVSPVLGQCRLSTPTTTSLKLMPQAGNLLTVNGVACTIPDTGVTLAAAPAAANTTYYIYAVATSGAISSIEASTTGWSVSTTVGNKGAPIKTGDDTRTLVGMARGNGSTLWADAVGQRFVSNFWNRRSLDVKAAFTAGRAYATVAWGEINSEIRNEFVTWGDEAVEVIASGYATMGGLAQFYTSVGVDGTTVEDGASSFLSADAVATNTVVPFSAGTTRTLSEGYHYVTLLSSSPSASSQTYAGAAAGSPRCVVRTVIRG